MHLLVRKSQRDDGWFETSMTFILDGRLDLDEEEELQFRKYQLHDRVVYNSEAFLEHLNAADEYRDKAGKTDDLGEIFTNSVSALYHNIAGKIALQLTLQNLIDGIRIETQDLEEAVRVHHFIRASVAGLASYLEVALTFDEEDELDEY